MKTAPVHSALPQRPTYGDESDQNDIPFHASCPLTLLQACRPSSSAARRCEPEATVRRTTLSETSRLSVMGRPFPVEKTQEPRPFAGAHIDDGLGPNEFHHNGHHYTSGASPPPVLSHETGHCVLFRTYLDSLPCFPSFYLELRSNRRALLRLHIPIVKARNALKLPTIPLRC